MTARTMIREALQDAGVPSEEVSQAPAGGRVAWFDKDDDITRAVMAVENDTPLVCKGENTETDSYVGLRFDWPDDAPNHRTVATNPRGVSLGKYAEWMDLSRPEARRALTGLHHATTETWKDDSLTPHVIRHGPGVLPESETCQHSYHYYVE